MTSTARTWLTSIIAAAVGGAANAVLGVIAMPDTFNFTHTGWVNIGKTALIGALIPVLTLLKQSPIPSAEITTTTTAKVTTSVEGNPPQPPAA
jgi:hypothetical protein